MAKDRLFLLKPDFRDAAAGPFYCPDCAGIEGLLSYYPQVRSALDVVYVDFPRPRTSIVSELGAEHQGCPVLIVQSERAALLEGLAVQHAQGRAFLQNVNDIRRYLSAAYAIGSPH